MKVIVPMAGEGKRFAEANYKESKPAISTIYRVSGEELPMVVCAVKDLPGVEADGRNVCFIDRDFHRDTGVEEKIKLHYPNATFITIQNLTEGQACTCMLAEEIIDTKEALLIAGCDNGMVFDMERFSEMTKVCDALVFTYRNNEAVQRNPDAYGWVVLKEGDEAQVKDVSVKKAISDTPMQDHAIVATFWFKHGEDFVRAAKRMLEKEDRVNGEYYVDSVIRHCVELGMDVRVFEIKRYIGWGTPKDYEEYQSTMKYWREFTSSEGFIPGSDHEDRKNK